MPGFMENGHVDTGDASNGSGRHPPSPPQSTSASPSEAKVVDRFTCFLCHGRGHWARDCTSLPAVYLVENPPRCYTCGGIGHYARFCPSLDPIRSRTGRERTYSDPLLYYQPSCYFPVAGMAPPAFLLHPADVPPAPPPSPLVYGNFVEESASLEAAVMPSRPTCHLPHAIEELNNENKESGEAAM